MSRASEVLEKISDSVNEAKMVEFRLTVGLYDLKAIEEVRSFLKTMGISKYMYEELKGDSVFKFLSSSESEKEIKTYNWDNSVKVS